MQMKLSIWIQGLLIFLSGWIGIATSQATDVEGYWRTDGYGYLLHFSGSRFKAYEVNRKSCMRVVDGRLSKERIPDLGMEGLGMEVSLEQGGLALRNNMTQYFFARRVETPPASCQEGGTPKTDDPVTNFEVFWSNFDEHYAFFDLYGVDWQQVYEKYRPRVTANTSPDELYAIFTEMLSPLKDDHIILVKNQKTVFTPVNLSSETFGNLSASMEAIKEMYIEHPDIQIFGDRDLFFRRLNKEVGYLLIDAMAGFAKNPEEEKAAAEEAIDQALSAAAGVKTLILDLRFNEGGWDGVSLALASRFADRKRLAFTKHAREGNGFTALRSFYVEPAGSQRFSGKVILLTSRFTVSAAEVFVLAMRTLPNVTLAGETTAGAFSDMLERHLPNGWTVSLSNEVYRAADGKVYEYLGLSPEIKVPLDPQALTKRQDEGMEKLLSMIGQL